MNRIKIGEFGKVLIRFASSQIISNGLRILSGFLVVRFLDPTQYGLYSSVGIYLGYILLGHGGIINGLSRELPYELGRGNDDYAREMASSVFVLSLFISFIASLVFLSISIHYFLIKQTLSGLIFLSYTVISALHLLDKQFLPVLYRTNKDFGSLSKQNIKVGLGNLLSVILVFYFGIYGLVIRGVLLSFFQFYLLFKNKPYSLDFKYKFTHFVKLFKTGLPVFMVGQVNSLWATIMNNIIFSMGGATYFGLYALSNIIQGAIGVIPNSFSQVIYPRMAIMLGEGKSVKEILIKNVKPLFFQFGVMLFVAVITSVSLPLIIPIVLPKYTEGVQAAQWMCFVPLVLSFGALGNIYNVIKKQLLYFVALISGAIIGTLFVFFQIKNNGFYLVVFPQGLIIGKVFQQLLSLSFISIILKNE